MFRERRERFMAAIGPRAVAVLPSARVFYRNNDVEHEYRPDSDFYYLTGFDEPDAVLVLRPEHAEQRAVLFVRPRDPAHEVWDGPRAGVEGAVARHGADAAYPIDELDTRLPELLAGRARMYYALGADRAFDDRVLRALGAARYRARKRGTWPTEIVEPGTELHEMRLRKSEAELAIMRTAAEITRDAFARALAVARPGRYEHEVEAVLRGVFRARGAERPAYQPIVASGPNACVLHHRSNNRYIEDGDLLLIDAGAEFGCYASDVTRTFPVNGRFTAPQRAVYQLVLDAQLAAIGLIAPGATVDQVHRRAVEVLTAGLLALGLLKGELEQLIKDESYKRFYMHGTSHWLGMDVHDVGRYYLDADPRPLEPGCVITVEPGLYFAPHDETIPAEYRGIGVRIEDDVACTPGGFRVLTDDIPKQVDELEAILSRRAPVDGTATPDGTVTLGL
jgi:Xaa-Pro aminopeptidase